MTPTRISSAVALGAIATVGACTFTSAPENTAQGREAQGRDYAHGESQNDEGDAKTNADVSPPASTAQDETLATFTPTEVASILEVIDFGEVAQGRLAIRQGHSDYVRAFALHAVEVHGRGQERARALLGLEPTMETDHEHLIRDPTASVLLHQGVVLTTDMKSQTGEQFDMAYMTAQITSHATELALIDHSLFPSALASQPQPAARQQATTSSTAESNAARLLAELKATRKEVVKHLVHALRIQQALRNPAGATTSADRHASAYP